MNELRQVGGDHYLKTKMQPHEFCMVNAYDSTAFSALKYVARHHNKNGREDLEKAIHSLEIRYDIIARYGPLRLGANVIPASQFIQLNNIPGREACIIMDLHEWVTTGELMVDDYRWMTKINAQFTDLIQATYGS